MVFRRTYARMYVMRRYANGVPDYAPLYVHSFRLIAPRKLKEAQTFNVKYHALSDIHNLPDRLRWCRHHAGLMQKEVANRIGVTRAVYVDMETGSVDYCPAAVADRLSELYGVPVVELLDEYNLFLYRGQAEQVQAYRKQTGLGVRKFAALLGVSGSAVRKWESGQARMSRALWERCFKGRDFS